jgi:hypothetical protein
VTKAAGVLKGSEAEVGNLSFGVRGDFTFGTARLADVP